jgi:chemotaxis protein CheD
MSAPERTTLALRMARAAERVSRGGVRTDSAACAHTRRSQIPARPGEHLTLMPGQLHFGGHAATLRTLLGSCLAVTLWHPERRLGGMCHFLLPSRQRKEDEPLDGRYGDEALEAMVSMLRATGCAPADFQAHLYGGADTMPEGSSLKFNVGERNIEQGFNLVDRYGFQIHGVDVGEDVPRTVVLTLATGEVTMRRGQGTAPQPHLQSSPHRSRT